MLENCVFGVSFFVASIHLPSCSLRNMISFVHRHVYELFDHFFENLNGFLNPYSRSSRFFVLNFTPFLTLMSKVCGISFKSFPCVICLTRSSQAQARIACCFSLSRFASSSYPHMPWQGLHGTLTSPPPQPLRGVASTTRASHMER